MLSLMVLKEVPGGQQKVRNFPFFNKNSFNPQKIALQTFLFWDVQQYGVRSTPVFFNLLEVAEPKMTSKKFAEPKLLSKLNFAEPKLP
jgi:hypothetical protein